MGMSIATSSSMATRRTTVRWRPALASSPRRESSDSTCTASQKTDEWLHALTLHVFIADRRMIHDVSDG